MNLEHLRLLRGRLFQRLLIEELLLCCGLGLGKVEPGQLCLPVIHEGAGDLPFLRRKPMGDTDADPL